MPGQLTLRKPLFLLIMMHCLNRDDKRERKNWDVLSLTNSMNVCRIVAENLTDKRCLSFEF